MKKKLRFIPLFFMLSLVFTALFSMSAFALTDGDWEFQLLDDEVSITKYIGSGGDVVIPEKIFGAPVTKVNVGTFHEYCDNKINKITFPSTVKEVEDIFNPWNDTEGFHEIILPEGVERIGPHALRNCVDIEGIQLPSTINSIGWEAFYKCESLSNINIPYGVTEIKYGAFEYTQLNSVEIPSTVLEIGNIAFAHCNSLTNIKLPPNITSLEAVFAGCEKLEKVELPSSLESMGGTFSGCSKLESIILPTSLKKIYGNSFSECNSLKEIVIPYGVVVIQDSFRWCPNLKSVYVPDSVTTFFSSCIDYSPNAIIYCSANSTAAKECKARSISYLTDKSVNSLITVYYNGTRVSFHEYDQDPALINDRTLVPLRAIFEAMNADVQWDQATQTVTSTRDGITIKLTIGDDKIYKNGQAITTDVPAQIINERTMIPVRVIAEAFGADVEWNGSGRAVLINE